VSSEPDLVPQVGVALFGRDGRLLVHTPRFAELLSGAGGQIAAGADMAEVLAPLGGTKAAKGVHCGISDGRAIDIAFEPLPHNRCCMTVTDVTEARTSRDELRRAREEAEAAYRAKSTFLATMTHELRTPLNAVIGFSDALAQQGQAADPTPISPAEVTEFAKAIHEAGQHLLDRINTILDVARIESGRFDLAADLIEIGYMIQHCVLQTQSAAEAAKVRLTTEIAPDLPRVRGDERRLRQVMTHLLTNAVKFSTPDSEVLVAARLTPEGDLEIMVRDGGIGIAPEDIERVFEPFSRLDTSLTRRTSGTGLGLYVARCLVKAHGGSIHLASAPGRGTTAIVQLPHSLLTHSPAPLALTQEPS
jgi:signal transduction histidine kinase